MVLRHRRHAAHVQAEIFFFKSIEKRSSKVDTAAEVENMCSEYTGTVELQCSVEDQVTKIMLKERSYVPTMRTNLISLPLMQKGGLDFRLVPYSGRMVVLHDDKTIMEGFYSGHNIVERIGVSVMMSDQAHILSYTSSEKEKYNLNLLHRRLTHANCGMLQDMIRQNVEYGLLEAHKQGVTFDICYQWKSGKAVAAPHKPSQSIVQKIGEQVHSDLVGPVEMLSIGRGSYTLTVLDDASGALWVAFLKKSPFQIISGRKPNIWNVRIFGSELPWHVLKSERFQRGKFDPKTMKGINLGYDAGKPYRIYLPETREVILSRDVTFMEELVPRKDDDHQDMEAETHGNALEEPWLWDVTDPDICRYPCR